MTPNLTIAEVDALFFASLHARGTQVAVPKAPRAWVPRYDRCSGCNEITPCLLTTHPNNAERRTMLVCPRCWEPPDEDRVETYSSEPSARLFEP